jgi:formylglycine-generating enzyme required for sulfatase activity
MLETIMSIMEGARSVHEGYKFIHDLVCGNKQEEYLKQIASDTRDMKIHIERLSDHILYAASMDSVRAAQANQTRYVDDLKQIRDILLPLQQALNEPILSSAVIFSPQQIQSPSSVLEMISELNHLVIPEPIYEGEIPVLFVENGIYHVGWQRTDILSQKLGCETLSRWQVNNIVLPDSNPVDINNEETRHALSLQEKQGKTFRDTLKDGSEGPEMVWIPAGKFNMGSDQYDDEQPIHEVSVDKFAMGIYPVTFAEYDYFCEATNRGKPKDEGWGRDNRPVIYVSWHDAVAYTEWLSQQTEQQYRLPTEAEWEYAARAGTETDYWWGNDIDNTKANYDGKRTSPVGDYDANQFGLYDTAGNVWEWICSEYNKSYNGQEKQCATKASSVVLRGGSWSNKPRDVRSASRSWFVPTSRNELYGFRLVRLFTL